MGTSFTAVDGFDMPSTEYRLRCADGPLFRFVVGLFGPISEYGQVLSDPRPSREIPDVSPFEEASVTSFLESFAANLRLHLGTQPDATVASLSRGAREDLCLGLAIFVDDELDCDSLDGCQATVAEVETCVNAHIERSPLHAERSSEDPTPCTFMRRPGCAPSSATGTSDP